MSFVSGSRRNRRVATKPSMFGIFMSMRIKSERRRRGRATLLVSLLYGSRF
jgi:hypothetical protein